MTFTPDLDVLSQAYRIPFRHPLAAIRIFWPFMVVYELGSQAMAYSSRVAELQPAVSALLV